MSCQVVNTPWQLFALIYTAHVHNALFYLAVKANAKTHRLIARALAGVQERTITCIYINVLYTLALNVPRSSTYVDW